MNILHTYRGVTDMHVLSADVPQVFYVLGCSSFLSNKVKDLTNSNINACFFFKVDSTRVHVV